MINSRLYEYITQNISDILYCSICRQVFHKPQRINCAHTFCAPCLQEWLKVQSICPICRTKTNILQQGKDLIAQKFVEELMVKCRRCNWEGKRGRFYSHLKECSNKNNSQIISNSVCKKQQKIYKSNKFVSVSECLRSAFIDLDGNIQLTFQNNSLLEYQFETEEKKDNQIPLYSYIDEEEYDSDQIIILD